MTAARIRLAPRPWMNLVAGAVLFAQLVCFTPAFAEKPYLRDGKPDGIALLPPPPAPGSAEEAADLASARAVFQSRTPELEARATKSSALSMFLFEPAIGPFFKRGNLPKTEALFEKVKKAAGQIIDTPKDRWQRRRPYQLDAALSLGRPEPSYGYPSGHSTRGALYSLLFAELFPENREAILAIGRDIGWDRVLIGKHFPTDVFAGRVLGRAIFQELSASRQFRKDLAAAKAEIRALTATPAR